MGKNFENSLKELENVIAQLESNDVSLDDAIKLFEKGIALSKDCRDILDNAERKIKLLTECEGEITNG